MSDGREVLLHRADSGMPLLEAATERAAFYGLGYAQATDDPQALVRQFLLARGELATVDGEAAVERDRNQARWRIPETARAAFDALPGELQECYRAFVAGVAARFAEHPDAVPAGAPPLDPWLPIAVNATVMLYWTIADAVAVLRAEGLELPSVVSELDRSPLIPGSNAWVILPTVTADGATYLVSDPHLPFGGVHTMHEAAIVTPTLHYTGFTFLGAMLPALAHTADVAWGVTTGGPRASDAYRVSDTDAEAVELNGIRSPILARRDGWAYAVCTPYVGLAGETEQQLLAMLRARDTDALRAVLDRGAFPPQNLLAADSRGHGFYLRTGRVPRRPAGATGVLDADVRWEGYLDQSELVSVVDPASGWLQNCNSAPDTATPWLDAAAWSADAFNDLPGRHTSRSERSIELLSTTDRIALADVTAWALDDSWPDTAVWHAGLERAALAQPDRVAGWPEERRALLATLLAFDGHAAPESTAASAWLGWRLTIAATDATPERLRALSLALDPDLLLDALERTVVDPRPYGETHRFATGEAGRGGGFTARPGVPGDVRPSEQVTLRATFFADGIAVGGGPALRIVRFAPRDGRGASERGAPEPGMRSWSLLLPTRADVFARGEVLPTAFVPAEATLERRLSTGIA